MSGLVQISYALGILYFYRQCAFGINATRNSSRTTSTVPRIAGWLRWPRPPQLEELLVILRGLEIW
jgi:hypothetical protein